MLLTNPNKKSLEGTYNLWWTNEDNYTEEDYNTYKEILNITHSMYQNNDPSSDKPKSSSGEKWNELISPMWKELKATKLGLGLKKYHENEIEYMYVDNLNQLQQHLYYLYAQEKAGNDNFHNEKMGVINFISEQLKRSFDNPEGLAYIIRVVSSLPKGMIKSGFGVFNTSLNKLSNVMQTFQEQKEGIFEM
jgi:hypothetical protein